MVGKNLSRIGTICLLASCFSIIFKLYWWFDPSTKKSNFQGPWARDQGSGPDSGWSRGPIFGLLEKNHCLWTNEHWKVTEKCLLKFAQNGLFTCITLLTKNNKYHSTRFLRNNHQTIYVLNHFYESLDTAHYSEIQHKWSWQEQNKNILSLKQTSKIGTLSLRSNLLVLIKK